MLIHCSDLQDTKPVTKLSKPYAINVGCYAHFETKAM